MWVSRDSQKGSPYHLWTKKPRTDGEDYCEENESILILRLCPDRFERFTDLKLKLGECIKIRGKIHFGREE